MSISTRLQLLTCLLMYAASAHAIMVKYGTKDGPIEPPAPEPTLAPQPYRDPAPVWEERSQDTPDPNARWRPFFVPQPRYTSIVIKPAIRQHLPVSNAQRFVNAYLPENKSNGVPNQGGFLSSQTIPGVGLRYFYPAFPTELKKEAKNEDAKYNHIDEDVASAKESSNDFQWVYEKDSTRNIINNNKDNTAGHPRPPVYQFPVYVHSRHR